MWMPTNFLFLVPVTSYRCQLNVDTSPSQPFITTGGPNNQKLWAMMIMDNDLGILHSIGAAALVIE